MGRKDTDVEGVVLWIIVSVARIEGGLCRLYIFANDTEACYGRRCHRGSTWCLGWGVSGLEQGKAVEQRNRRAGRRSSVRMTSRVTPFDRYLRYRTHWSSTHRTATGDLVYLADVSKQHLEA